MSVDSPPQDRQQRRHLSSPVLIGRGAELSLLVQAALSPPSLALVEGEAGVGKTRLVRELISDPRLEGRRTLVGHCHRLQAPFPLGSLIEALRNVGSDPPSASLSPVVGALRPLLPELAAELPPQPVPFDDPRAERHRVFRALRELLVALGPAVCVLEDMHWADEGTLEFLAFLLSEPVPVLGFVLTYRGEELCPSSLLLELASRPSKEILGEAVELSPLSVVEVQELAGMIGNEEVTHDFAACLHERTAGIPFVVEEVIRLLHDRGELAPLNGHAQEELSALDVPPPVRHLFKGRMRTLAGDARLMVRSAAVLGVAASEDLVGRVAALARARATNGLAQALAAALLEEKGDGLYGFRHPLAAHAVYDEIPLPERRRLHLRAAHTLESGREPRPLAQIAYHFKEGGRPKQWARYAEAAAEAASFVGDDRTAARLLEQALSAPGLSRAARVGMAVKLGNAAVYSASPRPAICLLQRILDEEHMAMGVRGELRLALAQLKYHAGDSGPWREEMARAVGELRQRPELAAQGMITLAWPMLREGDLEGDLGWLRQAVDAAGRSRKPRIKISIESQRAAIMLSVGDPAGWDAVADIPDEGRSVEEKLALLRGYHSLSVVTLGLGYHRRAESFLAEVTRIHDELDRVWWGPWLASTKIALDWSLGRWQGLESRLREVLDSTVARPALSVGNQLILSSLLLRRGQLEDAERGFESALDSAQANPWLSARVSASASLARIRLARGDAQGAREMATLGLDLIKDKGIWVWARPVAPVAVQAFLACGESGRAQDVAEQFAAGLRGRDAPAAEAASTFCRGILAHGEGGYEAAAGFFRRAERGWEALPSPYEAARSREEQARCLLAQADSRGAAGLLSALETFEDLEARWDASRVRSELRAHGVALSRGRRGRRGYGDELSPREAEVAHMAGMGRKNREIAATLFLSPRTVEAHIASVLRKLGVDSRQALADVSRSEEQLEAHPSVH